MVWHEITYRRRMELTLWTELDKAGCILEPGRPIGGEKRRAFVRAVWAFQNKFRWVDCDTIGEILGMNGQHIRSIMNNTKA